MIIGYNKPDSVVPEPQPDILDGFEQKEIPSTTTIKTTVEIPISEFKQLVEDVAEIKRLLVSPTDNKFIETGIRIVSLENRLKDIFPGENVELR